MHKLVSKAFCHFVKNKAKRKYIYRLLTNKEKLPVSQNDTGGGIVEKSYHINGENNKIIIVENGIERLLYPNETINGLDIIINGNNNTVKLEFPIKAENSRITIGNDNVYVEIRTTIRFVNSHIHCCWGNRQYCKIGKDTTISGAFFHMDEESSVIIGEDCKISSPVEIWPTDGHSILDAETGEILNKPTGPITISDHCWIGQGVRITKNARIGNNCIVGGGAVAVKDYKEDNVVIAGNPAKIIKRGITWDRPNAYHLEQSRLSNKSHINE